MQNMTPELYSQLHADRAARLRPARPVRRRVHLHLPGISAWQVLRPRQGRTLPCPDLQPCP